MVASFLRGLPWRPVGAVAGLIILFALTVLVTGRSHTSELSKGLLQFIFFLAAAVLAVDLGRESIKRRTTDVLNPHGRKAVRRIFRLGQGMGSFSGAIETQRELMQERAANSEGKVEVFEVEGAFNLLEAHVVSQVGIVEDAIEDWRDVVPTEVEAIEDRARKAKRDE